MRSTTTTLVLVLLSSLGCGGGEVGWPTGAGGGAPGSGGAAASGGGGGTPGSGSSGGGAAAGGASSTGGGGGGSCPTPPAGLPSGQLEPFAENPLLPNGPESYDFLKTGPRVILKEGPTTYRMWYEAVGSDHVTQVGYATSSDGLTWAKQGPVMSPDGASWEKMEVSPNSVLHENGVYKLWYHGGGYFKPNDPARYGNALIGYATSPDGIAWTKHASNPVLTLGPAGAFDDNQVAEPRVQRVGADYRMYFTGEHRDGSNTQFLALGMATSADGISWTKDANNPLLPSGVWAGWGGAFFHDGGVWQLWHAAPNNSGLSYSWSTDGITWTDGPANPVLAPSSDPTSPVSFVGDSVSGYRDGDAYRILFTGYSSNLFGGGNRFEGICMASITSACP